MGHIDPTREVFAQFRESDRPGPIHMLNLVRLRKEAAYLDGRLFRGTLDGRILAYDFKTGKRLWETTIADPQKGETVDAAPIAWNGLVFIGVAFGDFKGVKGRVYALATESGRIVWETYLVPKQEGDLVRGPSGSMPASANAIRSARAGFAPVGSGSETWPASDETPYPSSSA